MKNKTLFSISLLSIVLIIVSVSCKKSSDTGGNNLTDLNGLWQTTVFGGANDTLILAINPTTANGTITYINTNAAAASKFAVNDILFSSIESLGNASYTTTGTYRYGNGNASIGHASATMKMNSSTVLFVHYSTDQATGITPPDYYYYKIQ